MRGSDQLSSESVVGQGPVQCGTGFLEGSASWIW